MDFFSQSDSGGERSNYTRKNRRTEFWLLKNVVCEKDGTGANPRLLSMSTPYPSNCICAARFTAALAALVGLAGGLVLTGRHNADHSASAWGLALEAHNAAARAARASQNCGYPASGSGPVW